MRKLILLAILILSISVFILSRDYKKQICFKDNCFNYELANDDYKRFYGLMFRDKLEDNKGMLFIFDNEDKHSFWMKNMKFSLDIIWINKNNKIVDIKNNVLPCNKNCDSLVPKDSAKYVFEVNAGFTDKNNINIGDKVKIF